MVKRWILFLYGTLWQKISRWIEGTVHFSFLLLQYFNTAITLSSLYTSILYWLLNLTWTFSHVICPDFVEINFPPTLYFQIQYFFLFRLYRKFWLHKMYLIWDSKQKVLRQNMSMWSIKRVLSKTQSDSREAFHKKGKGIGQVKSQHHLGPV